MCFLSDPCSWHELLHIFKGNLPKMQNFLACLRTICKVRSKVHIWTSLQNLCAISPASLSYLKKLLLSHKWSTKELSDDRKTKKKERKKPVQNVRDLMLIPFISFLSSHCYFLPSQNLHKSIFLILIHIPPSSPSFVRRGVCCTGDISLFIAETSYFQCLPSPNMIAQVPVEFNYK